MHKTEKRKKLEIELDKRWADFMFDITEMYDKFSRVHLQLEDTLSKLKCAVNPHNLPYGYGDTR